MVSPPLVYLPVTLDDSGEPEEIRLVSLEDGRVALVAYSALDRFAVACGAHHPWAVYETAALEELREASHFDVSYLDVPLPVELRMTESPA